MYTFYGFDEEGNRQELEKSLSLKDIKAMGIVEVRIVNETEQEIKSSSEMLKSFFEDMNKIFGDSHA